MKNSIKIPVYSEQDLTPKAQDTIRIIVNDSFPGHDIKFIDYLTTDKQVLVFGSRGPLGFNYKLVYTYSIAQIMTKPNAATVLKAAIRQFITEPEPIPFEKPLAVFSINAHESVFLRPTAIDIETTGDLGGKHTPEEVKILSVAIWSPEQRQPWVMVARTEGEPLDDKQLAELAELLPKYEKAIYHNGKFDIRVLNRVLGVELTNWFDTMLAHHVLNHAAGDHKLKHLARQYLGANDWEGGINKFLTKGAYYEKIPRKHLVEYNGYDVYWTYKLWELFAPQIEQDEENQKAFMLEMAYADFLLDVEKTGIPFDIDYATTLGSELQYKANMVLGTLKVHTGNDNFNPGSWQQVKKWLESQHYPVTSTDEAHITTVLEESKGKDPLVYEFCQDLLEYRKLIKMRGTYTVGWSKHARNGRVHPTFLVHGTSTGRLSSTGPNAQNVPRDKKIRRMVAV